MRTQKGTLYQMCLTSLAAKIEDLQQMIGSINESKNNETKSSAGDKYETGRAMMQMEEDKITAQLELARHTKSKLQQIAIDASYDTVRPGSLVKTNKRYYFLAVSLGKMIIDDTPYFCISADSPIGKLLLGKRAGEDIVFNGQQENIVAVC